MNEIGRRRTAAVAFILAAIAATTTSAADDEKVPLEKFAAATKAMVTAQCGGFRHDAAVAAGDLAASTPAARAGRILTEESLKLACDCAPHAIDAYVASKGGDTLVSLDAVADELKAAIGSCTAPMLRAISLRTCDADVDPFAKPGSPPIRPERLRARCACVQAGMTRLSDRQINEASEASHRDFEARVKARSEGASAPSPSPNALNDLERTCRAEDAVR